MKKLSSWRWARLGKISAYKKIISETKSISVFICLVLIVVYLLTNNLSMSHSYLTIGAIILIIFLCWLELIVICVAQESFRINLGTNCYNVYIYSNNGLFDIELVNPKNKQELTIKVAEYERKMLEAYNSFIYRLVNDDEWYLTSSRSDSPLCLGKRLKKTVFMSKQNTGGRIYLNILLNGDIEAIEADIVVMDSYYIPPFAQKCIKILQEQDQDLGTPDDYLITKNHGRYEVYGIFFNENNKLSGPKCYPVIIPAIIIHELNTAVILVRQDNEYKELYRKQDIKRQVNNIIIELTDEYNIGGIVWKYVSEKQELIKLYQGNFYVVDFEDGEIRGDNNWKYVP